MEKSFLLVSIGANGYTITVETQNLKISYSHISPNFLFNLGDLVIKNSIIAYVGPKNVYDVINNPYKDSNGNPTNRCNNRSTSTFKHKKRRHSRQSFRLFFIRLIIVFALIFIPVNIKCLTTFRTNYRFNFIIIICLKFKTTIRTGNKEIIII